MLARIALGAVFLLAGGAKIADHGWVASAREFGLSKGPAWLVPLAEITLGSMMVAGLGGSVAVSCGIALLMVFSLALAIRLRAGQPIVCACFGAWSRRPISWWTLLRNVFLMLLGYLAL